MKKDGLFSASQTELMAHLVQLGVPAENVGEVIRLTLRLNAAGKLDIIDPPSSHTALRAVIQMGCAIEYEIARALHRSRDLLVSYPSVF